HPLPRQVVPGFEPTILSAPPLDLSGGRNRPARQGGGGRSSGGGRSGSAREGSSRGGAREGSGGRPAPANGLRRRRPAA
ncbi:MAG: hypothetical protein RLZZ624_842, partial [Cyanobacteriota bacterium]